MSVGQMRILGIDVAKAKLDVALLLPDGKFRSEAVPNMPEGFRKLAVWLERHGAEQVHACMEAAGIYWEAAAAFLAEKGHAVSVVNPAQIRAFGHRRPEPHEDGQERCPPHRPLLRETAATALGAASA